jgi:hypothetical protein
MAEKNVPQSQSQQLTGFWAKAFADHVARTDAMYAELDKIVEKGTAQACANLDEANRLAKESLLYASDLANAWRKLTVEAARRAVDVVGPAGTAP